MALYQDGILISGANTLPKMTLADYKAMPVDQRPTYWERLDADYDDVLAPKTDIATVESGTTASRAYSVGELVYVSGTLYRVKTAIASGATFTVGTNIEAKNVSEALKNAPINYKRITGTGSSALVTAIGSLSSSEGLKATITLQTNDGQYTLSSVTTTPLYNVVTLGSTAIVEYQLHGGTGNLTKLSYTYGASSRTSAPLSFSNWTIVC